MFHYHVDPLGSVKLIWAVGLDCELDDHVAELVDFMNQGHFIDLVDVEHFTPADWVI